MPWSVLGSMLLTTMVRALLSPFFWLVVLLVAVQHRRLSVAAGRLGDGAEPLWFPVLSATALGILGGLAGSVILLLLGIALNHVGVGYLWLVAVFLMLVHPRFLCFSYAGGLLSLSSLAFGFPVLQVPQLAGLVGALHLVESLLMLIGGHLGATPVYVRLPEGAVVGAFNLQRFWPIPLVAAAMVVNPQNLAGTMAMPDWWPLIRPEGVAELDQVVYLLLPVVAALGYGDLALSSLPERKSRRSALFLLQYSLVLLALAVAASYYRPLALVAAVFAPAGHEWTIHRGKRAELRNRPLFVPPARGVMVLDAVRGSVARRSGLRSGCILRAVNGRLVDGRDELAEALAMAGPVLDIEYINQAGEWRRIRTRQETGRPLGLILAPEPDDQPSAEVRSGYILGRWLRRMFRK